MTENKNVNIKNAERLLTETEKTFILNSYKDKTRYKVVFIIYLIGLIPFSIISGLFYFMYGFWRGVICFVLVNIFFWVFVFSMKVSVDKQVKNIKKNKLYVQEAIYERSDRYGTGYFKMARRSSLYAIKAMFCEPDIRSGDKVILIQKKGQVWVYKARG